MRRANRVDNNQSEIDAALRRIGAVVIPMTGDPAIGFDRLVAYRGRLFVIEVKSDCGKLTEGERFRQEQLASVGVIYHVVKTEDEALAVIGVTE